MNNRLFLTAAGVAAAGLLVFGMRNCQATGGRLDPNPPSLDFGKVFVGQTAKRSTVYTNNHAQDPANIIGFGTGDAPFGAENNGFAAVVLQPGQTTPALAFTFTPPEKRTYAGRGGVGRQPPGPQANKVELKGEGVNFLNSPAMRIAVTGANPPEFVDFGNVRIGQSGTQTVSITNATTAAVNATGVWGSGGGAFRVAAPGNPVAVPQNGSVNVDLRFTPTEEKEYLSAIVFVDPARPSTHTGIVVKGRGVRAE